MLEATQAPQIGAPRVKDKMRTGISSRNTWVDLSWSWIFDDWWPLMIDDLWCFLIGKQRPKMKDLWWSYRTRFPIFCGDMGTGQNWVGLILDNNIVNLWRNIVVPVLLNRCLIAGWSIIPPWQNEDRPLKTEATALFFSVPSGDLTVCYWKWPSRNSWFTY